MLENQDIMDFSDTQDIDDMFNIFHTKLLKALENMLYLKLYHKKEKKVMNNKTNTSKNRRKE